MFCRKCGANIPDDSAFCPKCGEKVATGEAAPSAAAPKAAPAAGTVRCPACGEEIPGDLTRCDMCGTMIARIDSGGAVPVKQMSPEELKKADELFQNVQAIEDLASFGNGIFRYTKAEGASVGEGEILYHICDPCDDCELLTPYIAHPAGIVHYLVKDGEQVKTGQLVAHILRK